MATSKKTEVKTSTNVELNALIGIRAKVEFLKNNWSEKGFELEFGHLTQQNVADCIGCSINSVAVYWKNAGAKTKTITVVKTKGLSKAKAVQESIVDAEPVRNVTYSAHSSTGEPKTLKELYLELSDAHGELETVENQMESVQGRIANLETEIQLKRG